MKRTIANKSLTKEENKKQKIVKKTQNSKDFFCFKIPLFFSLIDVYVGAWDERRSILKRLSKRYNICFDNYNIDGDAAVVFDLQNDPINLSVIPIIFDDLPSLMKKNRNKAIALIAHELLHAVNIIITSHGLACDNDKDETAAYLLQNMMNQFLDEFEKIQNKDTE